MSDWNEVVEEGQVFYVHEKYGNIMKLQDNMYVAIVPKIIKLGPFHTIEQAKDVMVNRAEDVNKSLESLNEQIVNDILFKNKGED